MVKRLRRKTLRLRDVYAVLESLVKHLRRKTLRLRDVYAVLESLVKHLRHKTLRLCDVYVICSHIEELAFSRSALILGDAIMSYFSLCGKSSAVLGFRIPFKDIH
jgi:Cdc6-like AAA superfamily ATPase